MHNIHVLDNILTIVNSMFETGYTIYIKSEMKVINLMHAFNHLLQQANLLLEVSNILQTLHNGKPSLTMELLNL